MYRAVTWLALRDGVDLADAAALTALADAAELAITADPAAPRIVAAGTDVTTAVRSPEVTAAVSAVSAVPGVREAMVRRQRELIGDGRHRGRGPRHRHRRSRPTRPVKIFLTADPATRAAASVAPGRRRTARR